MGTYKRVLKSSWLNQDRSDFFVLTLEKKSKLKETMSCVELQNEYVEYFMALYYSLLG